MLCRSFNKDCSSVAAGCYEKIKIYQFNQGTFTEIQVLKEHKYAVFALNFMKLSNQLISGDSAGLIFIWSSCVSNQWNCQQIIQEHSEWIRYLISKNNEDLFISSSNDKTIRFWVKKNEWICQQSIEDHTAYVYQLSLNDSQNKIISCGADNLILVIEYSEQHKIWIVTQNMKVDCLGFRL